MSGAHLSAEALQQYILDKRGCTTEDIAHVDSCPNCQTQVEAYTLLMKELSQQPAPKFGFDVSALVMRRLTDKPVAGAAADRFPRLATAALILVITAVPAWLFRKSAYYVFTDISAVFLYLILAAAGVFVLLRVLHLMKRYQQIINIINK